MFLRKPVSSLNNAFIENEAVKLFVVMLKRCSVTARIM